MPILELPPNPAPPSDPSREQSGDAADESFQPLKLRAGRHGELEAHELIHLLDSIDDELSRSRFRESIYISTILCLAVAWFLFYGPRVLFHQPEYKDLISAMKEHDKAVFLEAPTLPRTTPRPPTHSQPDHKLLQQLQSQPRPAPPAPAQQQPPQEQARATPPPPTPAVQQPLLPLPSAPRPAQPLVDAPSPRPQIAQAAPSAHDSMRDLARAARSAPAGEYGASPGSAGPLQAGAQILSDTQGVDFSAYMKRLHHDIQRNWEPLIPEEVQPPLLKKGITGIRFTILPGGQIGAMTLETISGDRALDEAAWNAIRSEGNFPPLPTEFHGPQLELRVGFFYNTPIQ